MFQMNSATQNQLAFWSHLQTFVDYIYIQDKSEMLLLVYLFNIIVAANTSFLVSIILKGILNVISNMKPIFLL